MFPEKNENEIIIENNEAAECETEEITDNKEPADNTGISENTESTESPENTENTENTETENQSDNPNGSFVINVISYGSTHSTHPDTNDGKNNKDKDEHSSPDNSEEKDTKKEQEAEEQEKEKEKKKEKKNEDGGGLLGGLFDIVEMVAISISIVIILITFFVRYSKVDGSSMTYTINDNDCVLVQIIGYKPTKGDIVVLQAPDYDLAKPLIKRVIATEHDRLEINFRTWEVKVNGITIRENYVRYNPFGDKQFNETYLSDNPGTIMHFDRTIEDIPGGTFDRETYTFKITIPTGKIFVMGDNRNNSHDSRSSDIGLVDERFVVGKAGVRIYPFEDFGVLD